MVDETVQYLVERPRRRKNVVLISGDRYVFGLVFPVVLLSLVPGAGTTLLCFVGFCGPHSAYLVVPVCIRQYDTRRVSSLTLFETLKGEYALVVVGEEEVGGAALRCGVFILRLWFCQNAPFPVLCKMVSPFDVY